MNEYSGLEDMPMDGVLVIVERKNSLSQTMTLRALLKQGPRQDHARCLLVS
jgi:hypothetical protein